MDIPEKVDESTVLLRVDKEIYRQAAILQASYCFTGECFLQVVSLNESFYGVYFTAKKEGVDIISQVRAFSNELIDQELRASLKESTQSIRELIIRKAFSSFQNE